MAKTDAPRRGKAAQNSADADVGYEVGYGKPPKQGRFKPGQSGNPKGRPKHRRNLRTLFEEVLKETLTIREGDRTRTLTKNEAMVRTVVNGALRKEPKALQAFLVLGRATAPASVSGLLMLIRVTGMVGEEAQPAERSC